MGRSSISEAINGNNEAWDKASIEVIACKKLDEAIVVVGLYIMHPVSLNSIVTTAASLLCTLKHSMQSHAL